MTHFDGRQAESPNPERTASTQALVGPVGRPDDVVAVEGAHGVAGDAISSGWRGSVAELLLRFPSPVRDAIWRARWSAARARRRRLEARGDYSLSAPAAHNMDQKLSAYLDFDGGFFVEAGAHDGYHQSNTYWLERARGWRGVLVEPVPSLFREATRERNAAHVFNCALVADEYSSDRVQLVYGGLMTTVAGARASEAEDRAWVQTAHALVQEKPEHDFTVPARTLSSILDQLRAPRVDLLSLDVEGYEAQVLAGLDLPRHAPRWVLVEVRAGASTCESVEAILGQRYSMVANLSPFDVLYRCND